MYYLITKEITMQGMYVDPNCPNGTNATETRKHPYLQFLDSQSDTSMASPGPGVMGTSNGVVKPDADVDDGMDISAVSFAVPRVMLSRNS